MQNTVSKVILPSLEISKDRKKKTELVSETLEQLLVELHTHMLHQYAFRYLVRTQCITALHAISLLPEVSVPPELNTGDLITITHACTDRTAKDVQFSHILAKKASQAASLI